MFISPYRKSTVMSGEEGHLVVLSVMEVGDWCIGDTHYNKEKSFTAVSKHLRHFSVEVSVFLLQEQSVLWQSILKRSTTVEEKHLADNSRRNNSFISAKRRLKKTRKFAELKFCSKFFGPSPYLHRGKGKAIPVQASKGHESARRF